jgi:DNA-binding transcriptional MerR regulator
MRNITYTLEIILDETGFREDDLIDFIEHEIITPFDDTNMVFDEEDLRRLKLIKELRDNCNSNHESLQVILHLVDQVHYLRKKLKDS